MRQAPRHVRWLTVALVVTITLALAPMSATAGQHRGGGGGGGNSGGNSGGGHTPSGGGQPVGTATPRSDGGSRSGGSPGGSSAGGGTARTAPAGSDGSRGSDNSSNGSDGDTSHSRPRDGQPVVGRAVPRPGGGHGGGGTVVVPGGGWYYPWGYGGFGFAGYYYGGGYDSWFDGDPNAYSPVYEGALRLKVKPREAQVFVDGYFAGQVDQYDGVFQRLTLDSGPHRIEVSAEGYETLSFDIRVIPDRTVTYEGELRRAQ